jgi:DNA modification methylase
MKYPDDFINKIIYGDCLKVMKTMPDNCIDTIITDSPYGLKFMGKKWDYDVPSIEIWQECLKVLKPGGTALIFAGSRTQHRMAVNVEDAGFILKDCIMWLYGSGFPKATDISKQIDKKAEKNIKIIEAKKELGKWLKDKRGDKPQKEISKHFLSKTGGLTGCVANWELGFNLPTWEIWIKLKELLDLDNRFDYLIEGRPKSYIEAERKVMGKDSRKANSSSFNCGLGKWDITAPATPEATLWDGWKSHGLKPAYEPILVAMKPNEGSYANNALRWKVSGLNIDGARIPFKDKADEKESKDKNQHSKYPKSIMRNPAPHGIYHQDKRPAVDYIAKGRYPANVILNEESARMLDEQSGECKTGGRKIKTDCGKSWYKQKVNVILPQDNGFGASRFFYCAKASKSERNRGCEGLEEKIMKQNFTGETCIDNREGRVEHKRPNVKFKNTHPTVKPLALMKYLCSLTKTPTGGLVLDPFCGSGTTLMACKETGRKYIGIDNIPEYCEIARRRVNAIPESLF